MGTERNIEDKLIDFLVKSKGYEYVELHNSDDIDNNIMKQLSKLNNREITPSNLAKIKGDIKQKVGTFANYAYSFNSILQSGVWLPKSSGEGREPAMLMSKTFSDNVLQVARQVTDKGNNHSRYDVTILLNGFPIVQIELKNVDVEIEAAVNQINRYINTAFTGWFKYLQLFIVSNETNTRYSINNNSKLDKNFMFKWSDDKNNLIDNLYKFADTFLDKNSICDIITNYIVKYNTTNKMVVLRPYQIYAIKAAIRQIRRPLKANRTVQDNGYIFHTTGSGKTLTSYKCVQLAAAEPSEVVAKVVFLVDRRDLDMQTTAEFKSIDSSLDLGDTDSTKALLERFKTSKAIITTIQKFSIAVKKAMNGEPEYATVFGAYKNKKIVFIVDECHRTQFGKMHSDIDRYFQYSQYIGFTGTPIYDKNSNNGKTTEQLFGPELHVYKIENAIKDGNVLGFSVDYHNTIKASSQIGNISKGEVSTCSTVDTKEILDNPKRIHEIIERIYTIHNKKTVNRRYTALLAVSSIPALLKYYDEFKLVNQTLPDNNKLNISAIFTATDYEDNESGDSYKDRLVSIMNDFNKQFNVNCIDETSFRAELVKSMKCLREPHIDILIVVNMFLTGFDSKRTNTLYVDKNLEYHGLLQAFSRTNRVESSLKPFGNIVCFRPIKDKVDEAISLFNYGHTSGTLITKTYEKCLDNLIKIADEVMKLVPADFNMSDKPESTKVEFVKKMRKLNRAVQETSQFGEFSWSDVGTTLTEDNYKRLVGQYKNIECESQTSEKESILNYIDFCMELVENDKIDIDYIRKLIENVDISTVESTEIAVKNIKDIVDKATNNSIVLKRDLIKKFLDKLVMEKKQGRVDNKADINSLFRKFVQDEKNKEIKRASLDSGVTKETIVDLIDDYNITGKVGSNVREIVRESNPNIGFKKRVTIVETIKRFIPNLIKRFDFF